MSAINGTLYAVNSGSDRILHVIDASLNVDVDLPDASNKEGAGWGKHINGIRNWSIDISGTYEEEGSGMTPNEILAAIINRTADATIEFEPTSGGTAGWTGTGTFQNFKLDAPLEAPMKYSVTIKGNGPLAEIS